jgi:hypothetical protein
VPNAEDYQLPYVYDNFEWPHCTTYMGYPSTLFHGEDDDGADGGPTQFDDDVESGVSGDDGESTADEAEDDAEVGNDDDAVDEEAEEA